MYNYSGVYNPIYQSNNQPGLGLFAQSLLSQNPQPQMQQPIVPQFNMPVFNAPAFNNPIHMQGMNDISVYERYGIPGFQGGIPPQAASPYSGMGSYYTGSYGYNPMAYYAYMKQQREMEEQAYKNQLSLAIRLSKNVHKSLGDGITDEQIEMAYTPAQPQPTTIKRVNTIRVGVVDTETGEYVIKPIEAPQEEVVDTILESRKQYACIEMAMRIGQPTTQAIAVQRAYTDIANYYKTNLPDSLGLYDFLNNAGSFIAQDFMREVRKQQQNLTQLYKPDEFRKVVLMNTKPNSYASGLSGGYDVSRVGPNVDDIEITLPDNLKNSEYFERRKAFISSILGDMKSIGGDL